MYRVWLYGGRIVTHTRVVRTSAWKQRGRSGGEPRRARSPAPQTTLVTCDRHHPSLSDATSERDRSVSTEVVTQGNQYEAIMIAKVPKRNSNKDANHYRIDILMQKATLPEQYRLVTDSFSDVPAYLFHNANEVGSINEVEPVKILERKFWFLGVTDDHKVVSRDVHTCLDEYSHDHMRKFGLEKGLADKTGKPIGEHSGNTSRKRTIAGLSVMNNSTTLKKKSNAYTP
nr:hypothetical protein Iba_chr06aCG18730 [Ipomoea batatas]